MVSGSSGDRFALRILSRWTVDILWHGEWAAVSVAVDGIVRSQGYRMDRVADSMATIISLMTVPIVFLICGLEGGRVFTRENAVLRALGASRRQMLGTQLGRVSGLFVFGFSIASLYGSFYGWLLLQASARQYGLDTTAYPVPVFLTFPLVLMLLLLLLFVSLALLSYLAVGALSGRRDLAHSLDAAWTTSSFYGGME
jgi:hypothetical protein